MNVSKLPRRAFFALFSGLLLLLMVAGVALAAGRIDTVNKWAWSTNSGWINFAPEPQNGTLTDTAAVYVDHLEGYAWSENVGWIRLGTYKGGGDWTYANTTAADYGVNRDPATGALSGYAWSTTSGWINFAPTHGGVTVSSTGAFSGYAWGENIGWIKVSGTAGDGTPYQVTSSTPTAIELSSLSAGHVSGPAAWLTLLGGLVLAGLALRAGRRQTKG